MAFDNFSQLVIPRFNDYYDHWNILMMNLLWSNEYWEIVSQVIIELSSISITLNV